MIWIVIVAALIWGAGCIAIRYAVEPHTTTVSEPGRPVLAACSCGRPLASTAARCSDCPGGPGA
ncbi:hypothetical protein ACH4E8_29590 [Streptomyces sp. NPDC017979]|uniref:hypothetical protein n=1 Tax=Streptomyces sp. NPDC017979 TaxID=3365024 RepID=UPI0037970B07